MRMSFPFHCDLIAFCCWMKDVKLIAVQRDGVRIQIRDYKGAFLMHEMQFRENYMQNGFHMLLQMVNVNKRTHTNLSKLH